jgi:peptidoglycan/xylan/chitin deacetylase (PgdA/CDA1 family)
MSATPGIAKASAAGLTRRIIKLGISTGYLALCSGWDGLCRLLGKKRNGTGVVLYYHTVPQLYRARFEEQMRMVASHARPVAVSNLNHLPPDSHSVAITFDDALESFVENAVPVLLRLGIPATVFAVTDVLGTNPEWGKSYYSPGERVMSAEQLRGLPELICVGSHTLTHPDLASVSAEVAAREINRSREKLEALLQRPVTLFAFPYGSFNSATVRACRDAGYERVFATEPTLVPKDANEFVVGRVGVDPWDWRLEFRMKILGAYCWQPYAKAAIHKIKQFLLPSRRKPDAAESVELRGDAEALRARADSAAIETRSRFSSQDPVSAASPAARTPPQLRDFRNAKGR